MTDDPICTVDGGDAEMNAAIRLAQQTFPEFVREIELESRRIIPALDAAVVKAFFFEPATPARGEHMFVDEIEVEGEVIHGVLSGTPQSVRGLAEGQRVSFPLVQLSDWFIVIGGRGRGGYTLDVIAKRMPPDAYREASTQPPFSWFAWRQEHL
jgi:uncharacterized protein YegJ (DUF2314 family)